MPRGRNAAVHDLAVTLSDGLNRRTERALAGERVELGDVQITGGRVSVDLHRTDQALRADMLWWPDALRPDDLEAGDRLLVQAMGSHFLVLGRYEDGDDVDEDDPGTVAGATADAADAAA